MIPKKLISCLLLAFAACGQAAAQKGDSEPLLWSPYRELRDVKGIFCHPTDPLTAWAATSKGLLISVDEGQSWQPVAEATTEKVGLVTNLIVCPARANRLVMGTQDKGLFLSVDGGKSFKPLGDGARKPASAHIAFVDFGDSDPSWRTLYVTHGRAAPGISVSRDLGKTWEVFGKDRFLKSFVKDGDTIVAAGSMAETDGEVWGIHRSGFEGQRWEECNRGIRPGQAALPLIRPLRFLFSTLEGDVLQSNDDGRTWYVVSQVESASWGSLFFTYGSTDAAQVLVGYDPHREGVVLSEARFRPGSLRKANRGLYVGPFVKTGAVCRANANGTIFYIVMNDMLWIGRRPRPKTGPALIQVRCLPPSTRVDSYATRSAEATLHERIESAAGSAPGPADVKAIAQAYNGLSELKGALRFTVEARVEHPKGASAIKVVTVDLSILSRGRSVELFDDGKHADGKARDGLWARQMPFSPSDFGKLPNRDRRPGLPGRAAVTVTAIDTDGASDHWPAVLSIFSRPEPVSLWPGGRGLRFSKTDSEGPVSVSPAGSQGLNQNADALCFDASGPGPWRGAWIMGAGGMNISGRDALSFHIKGDVNQELYVCIVDRYVVGVDAVDVPHYGRAVPLLAGRYLQAITSRYQKVRIPMTELLPNGTLFLRRHTAGIALTVKADGKPGRYYVDQVQAEP